jgi:hypothetical protein
MIFFFSIEYQLFPKPAAVISTGGAVCSTELNISVFD